MHAWSAKPFDVCVYGCVFTGDDSLVCVDATLVPMPMPLARARVPCNHHSASPPPTTLEQVRSSVLIDGPSTILGDREARRAATVNPLSFDRWRRKLPMARRMHMVRWVFTPPPPIHSLFSSSSSFLLFLDVVWVGVWVLAWCRCNGLWRQ